MCAINSKSIYKAATWKITLRSLIIKRIKGSWLYIVLHWGKGITRIIMEVHNYNLLSDNALKTFDKYNFEKSLKNAFE